MKKQVPNGPREGIDFAYFPVARNTPSAGRTLFGGPWFESPLQHGPYANLTKGTWWNGNVNSLSAEDYPCAEECYLTCGLFRGWPAFNRAHVTAVDLFSTSTWETDVTPSLAVPNRVRAEADFTDGPVCIAYFDGSPGCVSKMFDTSFPFFYPQISWVDPAIVDPEYVFSVRNATPIHTLEYPGPGTFTIDLRVDFFAPVT